MSNFKRPAIVSLAAITGAQVVSLLTVQASSQFVSLLTVQAIGHAAETGCYHPGDVGRWVEHQGNLLHNEVIYGPAHDQLPATNQAPSAVLPTPAQPVARVAPAAVSPRVSPPQPVESEPAMATAPQTVEQQAAAVDLEIDREIAQSKGISVQEYRTNVEKYAGDNVPL